MSDYEENDALKAYELTRKRMLSSLLGASTDDTSELDTLENTNPLEPQETSVDSIVAEQVAENAFSSDSAYTPMRDTTVTQENSDTEGFSNAQTHYSEEPSSKITSVNSQINTLDALSSQDLSNYAAGSESPVQQYESAPEETNEPIIKATDDEFEQSFFSGKDTTQNEHEEPFDIDNSPLQKFQEIETDVSNAIPTHTENPIPDENIYDKTSENAEYALSIAEKAPSSDEHVFSNEENVPDTNEPTIATALEKALYDENEQSGLYDDFSTADIATSDEIDDVDINDIEDPIFPDVEPEPLPTVEYQKPVSENDGLFEPTENPPVEDIAPVEDVEAQEDDENLTDTEDLSDDDVIDQDDIPEDNFQYEDILSGRDPNDDFFANIKHEEDITKPIKDISDEDDVDTIEDETSADDEHNIDVDFDEADDFTDEIVNEISEDEKETEKDYDEQLPEVAIDYEDVLSDKDSNVDLFANIKHEEDKTKPINDISDEDDVDTIEDETSADDEHNIDVDLDEADDFTDEIVNEISEDEEETEKDYDEQLPEVAIDTDEAAISTYEDIFSDNGGIDKPEKADESDFIHQHTQKFTKEFQEKLVQNEDRETNDVPASTQNAADSNFSAKNSSIDEITAKLSLISEKMKELRERIEQDAAARKSTPTENIAEEVEVSKQRALAYDEFFDSADKLCNVSVTTDEIEPQPEVTPSEPIPENNNRNSFIEKQKRPTPEPANPDELVSLTNIAREKEPTAPGYMIQSWMRSSNVIEFLRYWETINNPNFDQEACDKLLEEIHSNGATLTPRLWSDRTKAIGMKSTRGKGGGTKANIQIAKAFEAWLYPDAMIRLIEQSNDNKY